ncbi:PH domain-containing protein, partial [Rhodococcus erythropolis]
PTEPAGRFLLALAVIGLFVMGGLALRQRPRLAVIEDAGTKSIAVQRLRARHEFTREQIDRVRLVRYPRLGRRVPMLEMDIVDRPTDTEKLLIFGRWDLGTSPEDVLDVLAVHGLVPPEK